MGMQYIGSNTEDLASQAFADKVSIFNQYAREIALESYQRYSESTNPKCELRRDTGLTLTTANTLLRCGALLAQEGFMTLFDEIDASIDQINYMVKELDKLILPSHEHDISSALHEHLTHAGANKNTVISTFKNFAEGYEKKATPSRIRPQTADTQAADTTGGITDTTAELIAEDTDAQNQTTPCDQAEGYGTYGTGYAINPEAFKLKNEVVEAPRRAPKLLITNNSDNSCDLVIRGMSREAAENITTNLNTVMTRTRRIKGTRNRDQKLYLILQRALDMAALIQVEKRIPIYFVVNTTTNDIYDHVGLNPHGLTFKDMRDIARRIGLIPHVTVAVMDENNRVRCLQKAELSHDTHEQIAMIEHQARVQQEKQSDPNKIKTPGKET